MRRKGKEGERTKRKTASGHREEREGEARGSEDGIKRAREEERMETGGHRQRGLNGQRWSRRRLGSKREKEEKRDGEEGQRPDTMVQRMHTVRHK